MHGNSAERGTTTLERGASVLPPSGLIEKLETTRRGMEGFLWTRCLLRVSLIALTLAGVLAAADWLWVLNTSVRAGGLLGLTLLAVVFLCRGLMGSRLRIGRHNAAEDVETAFPQLGQRVRTTLEYSEPTECTPFASEELVQALVADTGRRTNSLDFRRLIPWRSLRWLGAGLAGLVALFVILLIWNAELRTTALRLLLLPVHYTLLEVKPGDTTVKAGNDVLIEANLSGRPVTTVELYYRPQDSGEAWTKLSLDPADVSAGGPPRLLGTLGTTLEGCDTDLEYRVVAGPVESPVYRLTVLHPLLLKKFEAAVQPPAYTRRPAATVKERDFKVIAGSAVRFRITLDREPQSAKLLLHPAASGTNGVGSLPAVPLEIQGSELTGELAAVARELEYEIVAEAADGTKLEPSRSRIQVQPDRKPTIRFLKPKDQIEATPTTEVRLKVAADDDFGLSKVGIVYQIGSGPKKTLYLNSDPNQSATLQVEATLALEEHQLGFQDGVTYHAFVEDNHPTRPQRMTTELQFIDIRPYKRSYQMLETGGS